MEKWIKTHYQYNRQQFVTHQDFESPKSESEIKLANIWQEILNIQEIAFTIISLIYVSLIIVLQLLQRIRHQFAVDLPIRHFGCTDYCLKLLPILEKENSCNSSGHISS